MMTIDSLPYWLVNVPADQHPKECPEFLLTINAKDKGILSTPDKEYRRLSWAEVKEIVRKDVHRVSAEEATRDSCPG